MCIYIYHSAVPIYVLYDCRAIFPNDCIDVVNTLGKRYLLMCVCHWPNYSYKSSSFSSSGVILCSIRAKAYVINNTNWTCRKADWQRSRIPILFNGILFWANRGQRKQAPRMATGKINSTKWHVHIMEYQYIYQECMVYCINSNDAIYSCHVSAVVINDVMFIFVRDTSPLCSLFKECLDYNANIILKLDILNYLIIWSLILGTDIKLILKQLK